MEKEIIDKILEDHKRWLDDPSTGGRAILSNTELSDADLIGANLRGADLRVANLRGADLRVANLCGANLRGANLRVANLCGANLRGANLRGADLSGANLRGADLSGAKYYHTTTGIHPAPEGQLIGYKKLAGGTIAKLLIPASSKRSCATTRKHRCDLCYVLEGEGASEFDNKFKYRPNTMIKVDNFDEDRWNECSTGIHFFLTRKEAEEWSI